MILTNPKRWSIRPPAGVQINAGHPLATGLLSALLFNEGNLLAKWIPNDLTGQTTAGSPTFGNSVGAFGNGLITDGSASAMYWTQSNANGRGGSGGGYSMVVGIGSTSFTGFARVIASHNDSGGTGAHFQIASGSTFSDDTTLHWNDGVGDTNGTGNFGRLNSAPHVLTAVLDSANMYYYIDGILQDSASIFGKPLTTTNTFSLGASRAAGTLANFQRIHFCFVYEYARPLSASEIQWLSVEPFSMFVAQAPRVRYFLTSSAPVVFEDDSFNVVLVPPVEPVISIW